jgi:hypothetical protein
MSYDIPQYNQLHTLLAYLKRALRSDPVLLGQLERPDNIVASVLEHNPFMEVEDGIPLLFRTQLPCLAIWERGSERVRAVPGEYQGLHTRWGEKVDLGLAYAHQVCHGRDDLHPKAIGARISKVVRWQMREYLEKHRLDGESESFDLLEDGDIESVRMYDSAEIGDDKHDGFAANLTMIHYTAPYSEPKPAALQLIKLEIHLDDEIPATDGPIVYGDIDVTP